METKIENKKSDKRISHDELYYALKKLKSKITVAQRYTQSRRAIIKMIDETVGKLLDK